MIMIMRERLINSNRNGIHNQDVLEYES